MVVKQRLAARTCKGNSDGPSSLAGTARGNDLSHIPAKEFFAIEPRTRLKVCQFGKGDGTGSKRLGLVSLLGRFELFNPRSWRVMPRPSYLPGVSIFLNRAKIPNPVEARQVYRVKVPVFAKASR